VRNLAGLEINKRYRLDRLIGVGGMDGTVWRAVQFPTDREVAVKLLPLSDASSLQRFERGARLASKLNHPNITTIHDYGKTEDGHLYLAMELLEGRTLSDHIKRSTLDVREVLHVSAQLLRAIEHAHAKQIVHRDLKPANIFLVSKNDDDFFVKILDFGIARSVADMNVEESFGPAIPNDDNITQAHQICGTPEYMAPEQIIGGPPEPRTDLYALGVTMYRLLTGKLPFRSRDRHALYHRHLHDAPPPFAPELNVPPAIERVVMKALAKKPGERFADATEMRQALHEAGRQSAAEYGLSMSGVFSTDSNGVKPTGTIPAPTVGVAAPSGSKASKGRWLWAAAAVLLLGGGAFLVSSMNSSDSSIPNDRPIGAVANAPTQPVAETPANAVAAEAPTPAMARAAVVLPQAVAEAPPTPEPPTVVEPEVAAPAPAAPVPMPSAIDPVGKVMVTGGPVGAEIVMGDRVLGTLPLSTELPTGLHALVVRAPGHKPTSLAVEADSARAAQVVVYLERYGARGVRSVATAPVSAPIAASSAPTAANSASADTDKPAEERPRPLGVENRPRLLGADQASPVRVLGQ